MPLLPRQPTEPYSEGSVVCGFELEKEQRATKGRPCECQRRRPSWPISVL